MKLYRKYILFFGILLVLLPLGLIIPNYFKAGNAWGEWSIETVKQQTGHEPAGMKKATEAYHAPIPDYQLGKENSSISKLSLHYIASGLIGMAIIVVLTIGATKLMSRKTTE